MSTKTRSRTSPDAMTCKQVIKESQRWLDIISVKKQSLYQRRRIIRDTIGNFDGYYNKGYLEYRKSITEAGDFAAVEWTGRGSYFTDILGRKYLDCLGGYGIYSAGLRHPVVLVAGTLLSAQTLRIQPALNITRRQMNELLEKLDDTLRSLTQRGLRPL